MTSRQHTASTLTALEPTALASIDLNADLGEGVSLDGTGDDAPLGDAPMLDLVSSANIACAFHAGSPSIMRATVRAAAHRRVAIGAHPGYRDPEGFGRRPLDIEATQIADETLYQLGALQACCLAERTSIRYIKPHGALYHRVMHDNDAANAMINTIATFDASLVVLGLSGSALLHAAERQGLRVAREGFLDRGIRPDGTLVPRGEPGDLIHDPYTVAQRALRIVTEGVVETVDGGAIPIQADSLCIHGDGTNAAVLLHAVRETLEQHHIRIAAFVDPT